MMAADFFHKIRSLATDLAAADAPLHDDEILAYLLAGLPAGYDPFITSMTTLPTTPTLDDVFAHLVAFEARQLRHHTELQLNLGASVSFAGRVVPEAVVVVLVLIVAVAMVHQTEVVVHRLVEVAVGIIIVPPAKSAGN
jgi:hypothetical protein